MKDQNNDLKRVITMATAMERQTEKVEQLTAQLKAAQEELNRIELEDLPALMTELGLQEITLEDGSKIKVVEDLKCAITAKTKEQALNWLVTNNFGGLIKANVSMDVPRGERDTAEELFNYLRDEFPEFEVSLSEKVHPSTLKAFVKEQFGTGKGVPMDLFNVYPFQKAQLKRSK